MSTDEHQRMARHVAWQLLSTSTSSALMPCKLWAYNGHIWQRLLPGKGSGSRWEASSCEHGLDIARRQRHSPQHREQDHDAVVCGHAVVKAKLTTERAGDNAHPFTTL
jgi:hypothetical protein